MKNKTGFHPFFATLAITTALCSGLLYFTTASAEQIKISVGQQAPENRNINRPKQGMTKSKVKALFGEPEAATPAVGEPPISSWEYPEFTVYFEGDYVIHSVLSIHKASDK